MWRGRTEVRDPTALQAACRRLGLAPPVTGTVPLFSGPATGQLVQLPGWQYPIACDTASGQIHYDNYAGRWGDQQELERFLQAYACEKVRLEARRQGHMAARSRHAAGTLSRA